MFEINSKYELDHEYSRKFTVEKGSVDVMQVGVRPDDDINDIIVYYRVPQVSNRGLVLITNMKTNTGVETYYFQPEQLEISGNMQEQFIMEFGKDEDYLLFGGKANYLRGTGDQLTIIVDWTKKDAYFGFFMVWTPEDHCLTSDDRIVMDYGPDFGILYPEIDKVEYLRLKTVESALRKPDEQLTTVDMDDEDYEDILKDKLRIDDGEGFDVEYQDWDVPFGKSDTGTSMIIEIDGKDWLRKYSRSNNAEFTSITRSGNIGVTLYGVLSLINIAMATVVWFFFLGEEYTCGDEDAESSFCLYSDDLWWYAWFAAFLVALIVWAPVAIMWPVAYIGSTDVLMTLRVFCYLSMSGPYGLTEGVMVVMILAFLV